MMNQFEEVWVIRVYDDEPELKALYPSFKQSVDRIYKRFNDDEHALALIRHSDNLHECIFLLIEMQRHLSLGELEYWPKGCDPNIMNKFKEFMVSYNAS